MNWTDEKAEAILKIQFSYCLKPHYRPYDGFESHLDGGRLRYHWNLMSDNFHKTAVLKKKNCKLKLDRILLPILGAAPVPKFVRSLGFDFSESSKE